MASIYMLRFPRSDAQDEYVLVQAASTGSQPLDLKLVGTDGTDPYESSLRADRISKHREKSAPCTEDEWESILSAVLTDQEAAEDIEVTARVQSESQIDITFKKKIEQFSQRLGTLSLKYKPDIEIEVLNWCSTAIGAHEEFKARLASANHRAAELEKAVSELKKQLEELVKVKDADEETLLEGLQRVVNEKKVKIRQQQRLLASADVPTQKVNASQPESEAETKPNKKTTNKAAKKSAPVRAAAPSRKGKRKAAQQVVESEEDSDDGFEKMDVDQKEDVPLDEEQMTTEAEETASGTDEDDDIEPPAVSRQTNRNGSSQAKDAEADFEAPPSQNTRHKTEEASTPPAPRRLPFGVGKPSGSKPSAAPAADAGSETESDDEL